MKKLLSSFLIITVFFFMVPCKAFSQTPAPIELPKIARAYKGKPALLDGIIYSWEADAALQADKEAKQKQCDLKLDFEVGKEKAIGDSALKSCNETAKIDTTKWASLSAAKDKEIDRLNKIQLKPDRSLWWFSGGFIGGIALSLGIVYGVKQVSK